MKRRRDAEEESAATEPVATKRAAAKRALTLDLGDLTSIGAAVAALITTLSGLAVTGVLERAQRDEAGWLFAAFILVVIAALLWVAAAVLGWKWAQIIALVAFAAGLIAGIFAVLQTQGTVPRPSVTASLDQNGLLTGSVKAEALKSGDVIAIQIEGLRSKVDPKTKARGWETTVISSAFLGPDLNGKIDAPISLLMPTGTYESVGVRAWTRGEGACRLPVPGIGVGGPGCRVLPMAMVPKRPRLSLRWSGTDQSAVVVKVLSANSPKDSVLAVRVMLRAGARSQYLARTLLEPDSRGVADDDWLLPVPGGAQTVCAEARFVYATTRVPPLSCPIAGGGPARAIAELRRPALG